MCFFDLRQSLDVCFEPPRNGLPRHGKEPCSSMKATPLQASPQHSLSLAFQIRLLWLENPIRATVLAMILGISTTIGPIFDALCPLTDTADVRHRFLNHDPNSTPAQVYTGFNTHTAHTFFLFVLHNFLQQLPGSGEHHET
jgi:hypothetical protein